MADPVLYRASPRKTKKFIMQCLDAGRVPYVRSSPGMGKSSLCAEIAKLASLELIDHRLSGSGPEDLNGLPRFNEAGMAEFSPFEGLFPLDTTPLPAGMNGWLLLLDEFNSAPKEVIAAAYKLLLDRMVGQRKLHPSVYIVCAGNLDTDRAIVNPIGTAMQSRVIHIEMEVNASEWMEDVAIKKRYSKEIIAFLGQYPSKLMDFAPNHVDKTFCCPRTWEFVDDLMKAGGIDEDNVGLYAGTITSGVAVDFFNFTKVYKDVITVSEIVANPLTCRAPTSLNIAWATVSGMIEAINVDNFDALCGYAEARLPLDMRILFFRAMLIRDPALRHHSRFPAVASAVAKYLNE
ncbi:putative AAA domain protein [Erwinia phage vB_EamP_Rexella]|uniref:Putative AAA domain protein n=1 Tax=Erwinia phage vB_EamP_Rexella TaxID=1852642 RepID=A0A191ZD00_9CAUD|nr:putative AAA domain protein [Erwinia phage vB_EamP_Rexella]